MIKILPAQSETDDYYFRDSLTCVWPQIRLLDSPSKIAKQMATIYYGEKVEYLGKRDFIEAENRNYVQVKLFDGKEGWVNEYLFTRNGELAVMMGQGRIYLRPRTVSTITDEFFEPGELVVKGNAVNGWVEITGKEKKKYGWIKESGIISQGEEDLKMAALLDHALSEQDKDKRMAKLANFEKEAKASSSSFYKVISGGEVPNSLAKNSETGVAESTKTSEAAPEEENEALLAYSYRSRGLESEGWDGSLDALKTEQEQAKEVSTPAKQPDAKQSAKAIPASIQREELIDPQTKEKFIHVTETGSIYEVAIPAGMNTIYVAYHKTLPKGSRIQLQFPDNSGYVELEVIGKLKSERPQIIGLPRECVQVVYGTPTTESATIHYVESK